MVVCLAAALAVGAATHPAAVVIEYPLDGTIFPPDITAPTFLWRDSPPSSQQTSSQQTSSQQIIDIAFSDGSAPLRLHTAGAARAWTPDPAVWEQIKSHRRSTIGITGVNSSKAGRVTIRISQDPVGAPIFYRDVPLMPSEIEKGVIKPLAPAAIPLISWRLRYTGQPRSRLILSGLHSCTNCHSFSRDGKTMGMDVDGPENDKGTYAIATVTPRMSIASRDVITWNAFAEKPPGGRTIGFLSQISPDGQFAVTTLNEAVYVANFRDYRFLQVFYPTRGILGWYNRATQEIRSLPGADDPRYVHTDAVWSPDGEYLVFARAAAKDPYPPGRKLAEFANDPNEVPIQYDLYRIPFRGGKGGRPEPIAGASRNGMSNNFPKVSPDGKWIVFVQCRNGQLMRPDSQLYIVPAAGGPARRMRSNTALMNSWHSFSPNGRWLVFSSKSRSPYTQMFLTHIDEDGNDSPPVLIENATAPDRAVNIPEFVNIPPEGLQHIDVPAAEFYRLFDNALDLTQKGRHGAAVAEWRKALTLDPQSAKARTNLGIALWAIGDRAAAFAELRKAVELKPDYVEAHNNLGVALVETDRFAEAIGHFRAVLDIRPDSAEARNNLGVALLNGGKPDEAVPVFRRLLADNPRLAEVRFNLGNALLQSGRADEARKVWREGLTLAESQRNAALVEELKRAISGTGLSELPPSPRE